LVRVSDPSGSDAVPRKKREKQASMGGETRVDGFSGKSSGFVNDPAGNLRIQVG